MAGMLFGSAKHRFARNQELCPPSLRRGRSCRSRSSLCPASRSQISGFTRRSSPGLQLVSSATTFSGARVRHVPNEWPCVQGLCCGNVWYCKRRLMYPSSGASAAQMAGLGERHHHWGCGLNRFINGNILTVSREICLMVSRLVQPRQGETARRKRHTRSLRLWRAR